MVDEKIYEDILRHFFDLMREHSGSYVTPKKGGKRDKIDHKDGS